VFQDSRLRREDIPCWVASGLGSNRNAVVAMPPWERGVVVRRRIEEATTALRLAVFGTVTQGSVASSATPGWEPESRWDSLHVPDADAEHWKLGTGNWKLGTLEEDGGRRRIRTFEGR
jgi:hypothetical protein